MCSLSQCWSSLSLRSSWPELHGVSPGGHQTYCTVAGQHKRGVSLVPPQELFVLLFFLHYGRLCSEYITHGLLSISCEHQHPCVHPFLSCSRTLLVSWCSALCKGCAQAWLLFSRYGTTWTCPNANYLMFLSVPSILVLYLHMFCVHLPGVPSVSLCPARYSQASSPSSQPSLRPLAHGDHKELRIYAFLP